MFTFSTYRITCWTCGFQSTFMVVDDEDVDERLLERGWREIGDPPAGDLSCRECVFRATRKP
jgi:hypothetical protein